ncbi:hypothetical protein RhiirA4_455122 [Rhizophagus irregularis]|uniref:Serine-threonine/tyrosine-protein kinase catalytic domain-containing protein n=1 Tax=Rhizophagus irregularis TaxID=588596 RepID=A0A2I1G4I5_9GLOM|nr:hypothetical protein RhiirA4_455122 [Rhizophagus irregularis]
MPICGTPSKYVNLYQECWQQDPHLRPTTEELFHGTESVFPHFLTMATILQRAGRKCYQKIDTINATNRTETYKRSYDIVSSIINDRNSLIIIQASDKNGINSPCQI